MTDIADVLVPRVGGYSDPGMSRVIETDLTIAANSYFISRREHRTTLYGGEILQIGSVIWEAPSRGPWDLRVRIMSGRDVFIESPVSPVWNGQMHFDVADWQEVLFAHKWDGPGLRLRYRTLAGSSRNYPGAP